MAQTGLTEYGMQLYAKEDKLSIERAPYAAANSNVAVARPGVKLAGGEQGNAAGKAAACRRGDRW